jgi:hypothetical protein
LPNRPNAGPQTPDFFSPPLQGIALGLKAPRTSPAREISVSFTLFRKIEKEKKLL